MVRTVPSALLHLRQHREGDEVLLSILLISALNSFQLARLRKQSHILLCAALYFRIFLYSQIMQDFTAFQQRFKDR